MAKGKNISAFLMDGIAGGKIKAQISNWNGVAYKIPREMLPQCKDLEAFKQSGVYFLFGNRSVYVGQAEVRKTGRGIHQRILDHENDKYKNFWDEVVIFTTKDNSFGRTDISYLENRFYNKVVLAKRYKIQNASEPTIGTVTEEKEAELEEFMDQAELILGALGYKVFDGYKVIQGPEKLSRTKVPKISNFKVPKLPDKDVKIGLYIRNAMHTLSQSGYAFDKNVLDEMVTEEWSLKNFHTKYPFMKYYVEGKTDTRGSDGRQRFWSDIFKFGDVEVYVTKEWFEKNLKYFLAWYATLN